MDDSEGYNLSCHFLCPSVVKEEQKEDTQDDLLEDFLDDDDNLDETDAPVIDLDILDDGNDEDEYCSDDDEPEMTFTDGKCSVLSRDKKLVWSSKSIENVVKIENFEETPGPSGDAKGCSTPLQAWSQLFTEDVLQLIVDSTNEVINDTRLTYAQEKCANPTNVAEIKALIGLMYIIGAMRAAHLNTSWLWATDGTGIEIFSCLMSQRRFIVLLRCLRFSNTSTSLSGIKPVLSKFLDNCKKSYKIGEKCFLDATLVPFRGECSFLRYMSGDTSQYGMKVYCLVDSDSQYISNMEVCFEKPERTENSTQIVKNLCSSILGSGRVVSFNYRVGNVSLVEDLLENGIKSVCILKRNCPEIPAASATKKSAVYRLFRKGILISDSEERRILYTTVGNAESSRSFEDDIFRIYDDSRVGFENSMKTCKGFTSSRKSSRWELAMFYFLLNVAGCNSQIILESNTGKSETGRDFLKNLGRSLAQDRLQERAQTLTLPKLLLGKVRQFAGHLDNPPTRDEISLEPPFKKLKRCGMCARSADRKTKEWCAKCRIAICREHGYRICVNCVKNL